MRFLSPTLALLASIGMVALIKPGINAADNTLGTPSSATWNTATPATTSGSVSIRNPLTVTGTGNHIVFNDDQTEHFIKTGSNGGAIRFRGNSGVGTDRALQFGQVDNNGVWYSKVKLDVDTGAFIIGADPGSAELLRVGGPVFFGLPASSCHYFKYNPASYGLRLIGNGTSSSRLRFYTDNNFAQISAASASEGNFAPMEIVGSTLTVTGETNVKIGCSGDKIIVNPTNIGIMSPICFGAAVSQDLYLDVEPNSRIIRTRNWNASAPNIAATGIHTGTGLFDGIVTVKNRSELGDSAANYIPSSQNSNYTIRLNGLDTTSIGFHDSGQSMSSIRYNNTQGFTIGADDGWGTRPVKIPGGLTIGARSNTGSNALLSVDGTVYATEIQVTATNWTPADYVFAPNYQLKSLTEVANYIEKERHLPGIPSAKEQEKEGVQMGQMLNKHLEKIEELTLYAIQAQKERDAAKAELATLRARLERLENVIVGNKP